MAKKANKSRKQAIYHNRYYSTRTPDERERSLMPGTKEYKKLQAERLGRAFGVSSSSEDTKQRDVADDRNNKENVVEAATSVDQDPSDNMQMALEMDVAHDVAARKFRRRRSKERKIGKVRDIAQDALGRDIPVHNTLNIPGKRSMDDELQDDGVSEKAFVSDCLRDYEADLKEIYNADNNHDGKQDEDDITPGMRRMMKYM